MTRPVLDRLDEKTAFEALSGCWLWMGSLSTSGYGLVRNEFGRGENAHRVSYRLRVGAIPAGLALDHLCRTRACVNPAHLEPVTGAENTRRGDAGRYLAERTHCPAGHEYSETNTLRSNGRRGCRICKRAAFRRWHARKNGRSQ